MKRVMIGALSLLLVAGTAGAQRLTDQERRELETKLEQLRSEMRDLERQLGRSGSLFRMVPNGTAWAYTVGLGRPRIGVTVQTRPTAASDSIGAEIQAVTPDGPAAQAGLQAGDIVVRFNDASLARRNPDDANPGDRLIELARELDEGDTVRVQYRRGGQTRNATIVARKLENEPFAYTLDLAERSRDLAERARDQTVMAERLRFDPQGFMRISSRWSDMELTTLDADLGSYFGTTEGLLVVRAPKDSLLALKSGDVLLRIGGRIPTSPSHAVRILRSYEPGDHIRVEIMRNRRRTEVTATVPDRESSVREESF